MGPAAVLQEQAQGPGQQHLCKRGHLQLAYSNKQLMLRWHWQLQVLQLMVLQVPQVLQVLMGRTLATRPCQR